MENFSDIEFKSEINQINRYQGSRLNSVKAAVYPGRLASSVLKDVEEELKIFEDPYQLVIQCNSLEMLMKEQDL